MPSPDFVHCVFFWLRDDLTDAQRAEFVAGLHSLADSPHVATCRVGTPAGTPREVVDNSWDHQLLIHFADRAAHDAYQSDADPVHAAFVSRFASFWSRVVVYDSLAS